MIKIYTDGAYSSSRNRGGWAFVVIKDNKKMHTSYGGCNDTTNNRMEITGCLKAMYWLKDNKFIEATILTDSMYVIGTMTQNWKKNKNLDLWQQMIEIDKVLKITWEHVKGHKGNEFNEYCDLLAVHASHIKT